LTLDGDQGQMKINFS